MNDNSTIGYFLDTCDLEERCSDVIDFKERGDSYS